MKNARERGPIESRAFLNHDICQEALKRLQSDPLLDASQIRVTMSEKGITLSGSVLSKREKWRAEDCVHDLVGINSVHNRLSVGTDESDAWPTGTTQSRRDK